MRFSEIKLVEDDTRYAQMIKQQFPIGAGYELGGGMTHQMWYKELKLANRWLAAVVKAGELEPGVSIGNDFTIRDKNGQDIGIPGQMKPNGQPVAVDPRDKARSDAILAKVRGRQDIGESLLKEAARIQHAEDFIFWDGSAGAVRVLNSLEKLEQGVSDVTLKWDGSPSIIFGRDEDGRFILTDKSGFGAKGYDGRAKSAGDLEKMLMARPGARNPDPQKAEKFKQFAGNMKDIFDEYEKAVPKDFRGFFKGDLLYYNTPELKDGSYIFTPQIVTYTVKADSPMGKRIGASKTGVVIHRMIDENGLEGPLPQGIVDTFIGNEVFVVPPVTVQKTAEIDNTSINELKQTINRNAKAIDTMLNQSTLQQLQLSDFSNILYAYTNSKVDTGMSNMGQDFLQWLSARKQVSEKKKARIAEYIQTHKAGFDAVWALHTKLMQVKDDVIRQFDKHDSEVKQEIGPHGPVKQDAHGQGGEGYVLAHPEGDIKLVPREYFSKANRAVER